MKRAIPIVLILAAVAVAAGLAWLFLMGSYGRTSADGPSRDIPLPPFSKVVVEGFADVTLVQGGVESATLEAGSRHLPGLRAEVEDGTLRLVNGGSRRWWLDFLGGGARPARVTVSFRQLESIAASGAVKLRVDGLRGERLKVSASGATSIKISDLETKELTVGGSGAMKVDIDGRTVEQRVQISGAGSYRAPDLASDDARVQVSGAGRVVVQVEKTLTIGLSGAGSVEYYGNPQVTQRISGAGRVKRRDAGTSSFIVAWSEVYAE